MLLPLSIQKDQRTVISLEKPEVQTEGYINDKTEKDRTRYRKSIILPLKTFEQKPGVGVKSSSSKVKPRLAVRIENPGYPDGS